MRFYSNSELIRILNQHQFTVLFSGGKDSTAALLWVLDNISHDSWNVLYVEITENTHPLCTEYVKKLCEKFNLTHRLIHVKCEHDFYDLMDKWGPPLMFAYRWCLYQMKLKLFNKHARFITVDGIRRADSKVRKQTNFIQMLKIAKRIAVSPLATWTKEDVFNYIKNHGVELNPCYKIYGHSGNCMFCPYANERHIMLTLSDPYWFQKIIPALKKHEEKLNRGSIGKRIYERWMKNSNQKTLQTYINYP